MLISFLNPWFWLGALAVSGPIWLHLRRRKDQKLVRFSAVRFLEDQARSRRRPMQIRDWSLLLLRMLLVLLLVCGFSWPYLRHGASGAFKQSIVYILDNTLSRQAKDGFQQDRDWIANEISSAGPERQVAIVELTAVPRLVSGFSDDHILAARKVRDLQPSFQRGSYLAAFRQANSVLRDAVGRERRIVLRGDSQANQWDEKVKAPAFLNRVKIELPKPESAQLANLWLAEPRAERVFLGDKPVVNFAMRVGHLGPAESAKVVLRANNRVVLERDIDLKNQPKTVLLQAQCESDPGSPVSAEATIEGSPDSLAADNRVYFSVPPLKEGSVALLAHSPYLRTALSKEVMRGQWQTHILEPTQLEAELALRRDAEVLCLESAYLQIAEARTLVQRYLRNGAGVFLIINRLSPAIDGVLRELGFEPEKMVDAPDPNPERFHFVFSNHPIFHPFQSPEFANLSDIKVWRHARLQTTSGRPLIMSEEGGGLFFEGTRPSGKLFIMAFGTEHGETSWPLSASFIPFLDLTLQAARAQDPTGTAFECGEAATIRLPEGKAHEVIVRDGGREVTRTIVEHGQAQVRLPDKPGLYTMTLDNREADTRIVSVNTPAEESELVFAESPAVVKTWISNANGLSSVVGSPMGSVAVLQQRFWWWMMVAGLLALILETVLAGAKGEKNA